MAVVELREVTKKYGNKTVLDKFNLSVEQGEFISIIGESGCGKSTLLNIIGLLESFDSGSLIIQGHENIKIKGRQANKILREQISYIFQNYALVEEETVRENLELALTYSTLKKKERRQKIKEALDYVGLAGYEGNKVYQLSGGEQQRVALARILLKPSEIILADEPTGSLDEKNRDIIMGLLKRMHKEGKTIIVVTHDMYVADQSERIIKLA